MARDFFRWVDHGKVAGFRGPIGEDDLAWLRYQGIRAIVRMAEPQDARVSHEEVEDAGFLDLHEPVIDFTAPTQRQIDRIIRFILDALGKSLPVAVTCGAGKGRTGTILACYLVSKCSTAEDAISKVSTIEVPEQIEAIRIFEKRTKRRPPL